MKPKSLMTHYIEGSIISRELEYMMLDYAANERFSTEISNLDAYIYRVNTPGTVANNRSRYHNEN